MATFAQNGKQILRHSNFKSPIYTCKIFPMANTLHELRETINFNIKRAKKYVLLYQCRDIQKNYTAEWRVLVNSKDYTLLDKLQFQKF